MPGGYYLNNLNTEQVFELTNKTKFTFTDKDSGKPYTTTKKDEFTEYLVVSQSEYKVIYSVQAKNGKAVSVTEKPQFNTSYFGY